MESNDKRKRVSADDSEPDSPEPKILRVDSDAGSDSTGSQVNQFDSSDSQLARVDSGELGLDSGECGLNSDVSEPDSACVGDLQDDIFNILDDTETVAERDSAMQGLDSVMKSFEEEILAVGSDPGQNPVADPGELQPNLGYLLEASDDELGLPPTESAAPDVGEPDPEGGDLTALMGLEDEVWNYDAFGFGTGLTAEFGGGDGAFVTADGLVEYAEPADILWRSESLQAM